MNFKELVQMPHSKRKQKLFFQIKRCLCSAYHWKLNLVELFLFFERGQDGNLYTPDE